MANGNIKPVLPPKYVNIPAGIIYDDSLPVAERFTYMKLRGLAWNSKGILEIDWNDVLEILEKPRTTIYRHLARLALSGWLRFNSTHRRVLQVYFTGPGEVSESSHFRTSLNEDVNLSDSNANDPLRDNDLNSGGIVPWMGQSSQKWDNGNGWHELIDDEMAELLTRVGVYKDKFRTVVESGWKPGQIRILAETVLQELGPGKGGGVLLYRLKNTPPPQTDEERRAAYVEDLQKYRVDRA